MFPKFRSTDPQDGKPARGRPQSDDSGAGSYQMKLAEERATFSACENVHELPSIFHYWSNRYIRPKLELFGFSHPDDFFAFYLQKCFLEGDERGRRFASIGAGNCDTEVRLAQTLIARGFSDFTIECIDINEAMLERGRVLAGSEGVAKHVLPRKGDFNRWSPSGCYDAVIANQSLHHVVELEHLFDAVKVAIAPDGIFITSDMIGRNGHQLWPEAREIVHEFWRELPVRYRHNHQLNRWEALYEEWDCSQSGFEGIRAQDIMPLLTEKFSFELVIAFSNVIDPFVSRAFGHNFDATAEWDRQFVDRVHARDEAELIAGRIKPTHLLAVMRKAACQTLHIPPFTPSYCVRATDR